MMICEPLLGMGDRKYTTALNHTSGCHEHSSPIDMANLTMDMNEFTAD